MATQYSEIEQNTELSNDNSHTNRENKILFYTFICGAALSLIILLIVAWYFCHNNIYYGEKRLGRTT